jgi:hypothetical protein
LVAVYRRCHGDAQGVQSTAFPVFRQPVAKALVVVRGGTEALGADERGQMGDG